MMNEKEMIMNDDVKNGVVAIQNSDTYLTDTISEAKDFIIEVSCERNERQAMELLRGLTDLGKIIEEIKN
jgi:hypothetical protein